MFIFEIRYAQFGDFSITEKVFSKLKIHLNNTINFLATI